MMPHSGYVPRYQSVDRLWTVGYFDPAGKWQAVQDCASERDALLLIHFLNGGNSRCLPDETTEDPDDVFTPSETPHIDPGEQADAKKPSDS